MLNHKSSIINRKSTLRRRTPLKSRTRLTSRKRLTWRKDPGLAAQDKAFEYEIKEAAGFVCEVRDPAGCGDGIQTHHIISRLYKATRHDKRNGVCTCTNCHDNRKVLPWLQRTDPARYEWILEQKRIIHRKTG